MGTFKEEFHLLIFCLTYFLSTARYRLQNDNNTGCTLCSLQRTYPLLVLGTQNKIPALTPNSFFLNQIKHKYRSAKFVPFSNVNLCQGSIWSAVYPQHRFIGHVVMVFQMWLFHSISQCIVQCSHCALAKKVDLEMQFPN